MTRDEARNLISSYDRLFPHFFLESQLDGISLSMPRFIQSSNLGNQLTVVNWQNDAIKDIYIIQTNLRVDCLPMVLDARGRGIHLRGVPHVFSINIRLTNRTMSH